MIQNPSKDVTLIVYNTPEPPRYYKLNKGLVRTLIILIPLMVIISISISFLYSVFLKNKISSLKSSVPEKILELQNLNSNLTSELSLVKKTNTTLTEKLSKGSGSETSISSLGFFTLPIGINDLRSQELIKFEDIKVETVDGKILLKFNMANNSPNNEKLSGFITVVQYQGNLIQFFPDYELPQKNLRLEYTSGESFGFSRFRPTVATFSKFNQTSAKYKIYVFSRTGDLITYKQLGPFNVE